MKEKFSKEEKLQIKKDIKAFNEMLRKFKHALIN